MLNTHANPSGTLFANTQLGRIQPGVWYYNNTATAHQFYSNWSTTEYVFNESLPSLVNSPTSHVFIPTAMFGGKFHFRLKCLIHVFSKTQFGANWNSISGSTIEILPSLYGNDGTFYDAPNPAGLAIITDPFNGAGQYFFMAEWDFEWDLAGASGPTQPYDLMFKARFNTSANAVLGVGRGTRHLAGSQTPPHLGNISWLYNQFRAFMGVGRNSLTTDLASNVSLNRLALWTTET
jgi:hypothetical protein